MDTNNNITIKNLPNKSLSKNNEEKNKVFHSNEISKGEFHAQLSTFKNALKKDLYYNRNLKIDTDAPNRSKPKKDEEKTIALSDEEWESAGNPLGFEKLGTVKTKKKINVFTNLKEKELEEQIALLGSLDLNELSACDESYNPAKKSLFLKNNQPNFKKNEKLDAEDLQTNDLSSLIGLLAKSFVKDYSKNKKGNISLVVYLNADP